MEEQDTKFTDWVDSLTISDAANVFLVIIFSIFIVWLVIRTFRNKPSA
ncbi:hypothetical protein [Ekhidna sp.]